MRNFVQRFFLLCLFVAFSGLAIAADIPNNTIYYTSSDGSTVTPHDKNAFDANIVSNTYKNGQGIITFDGDVTSIGKHAFYYCSSLTSIQIPNSATYIGNFAFSNCSSLSSIQISNSATFIGVNAFEWCSSLTSIQIPNSVRSIENSAFWCCFSLTSIEISNSVTHIGKEAFNGCKSLTSIQIPNSVISIGNFAFCRCKLTSIQIPNSVTSIGIGAFSCDNLSSIKVDEGNRYYDSRNNCNAIIESSTNELIAGCKNTIIPNSVTSIGKSAFYESSSLSSIQIPNSVTSIRDNAFYYCSSLTSVQIPNSVTIIGNSAFSGCSSLASIQIPNSVTSIGNSAFSGCSSLASIQIPNSVTSIETRAFFGCKSLASILIPNSVTNIRNDAFYGCYNLESITCLKTTPPNVWSESFDTFGTLHVLPGCKNAYEIAEVWKNFTIIEDAVDESAKIKLDDGKTYNEGTTQENKDITYTRTFGNTSWQSLYIPFSMTYDDWKDDFEVAYINGIRQMDTDDDGAIDETIMDVVKIKSGSLIPNTPYLIKAKTTGNKTITVNNATLYKAESNSVDCSTTIAKYTFTGTYSTIPAATLLANNYYAMGGGSLIMTDGTSDLKPFRWYLNVESRSPMYNESSGAKAITINVVGEEEATGISQMSSDREHSSTIYDLNGRRMSQNTLKSGLYIKNGKKIIIK